MSFPPTIQLSKRLADLRSPSFPPSQRALVALPVPEWGIRRFAPPKTTSRPPQPTDLSSASHPAEPSGPENCAMCRLVVFKGTCPQCSGAFTWDELTQELSCLEAKNNGEFGMCKDGASVDEKTHDQECDACAAALEADEGYDGGTDDVIEALKFTGAGWVGSKTDAADQDQASGRHKNKKQRTS